MRADELLDAIGQADDDCIKRAGEPLARKAHRRWWAAAGSLAACLVLFLCMPALIARKSGNEAAPEQNGDMDQTQESGSDDLRYPEQSDDALEYEDTVVYYVDGDTLGSGIKQLPQSGQAVFAAWRDVNSIGDEVKLLHIGIEDNSTTVDNGVTVEHTVGEYFILRLTVSAVLTEYYEVLDETLLLESLKKTMTGYLDIDFDEYHLTLE